MVISHLGTTYFRSSQRRCSIKKRFLNIFTGKQLCRSLSLIKLQAPRYGMLQKYGYMLHSYKLLENVLVMVLYSVLYTAQKMKFSIEEFFSKCDQIRSFLRIWSHLLKKSLMENFIFLCSDISFSDIVLDIRYSVFTSFQRAKYSARITVRLRFYALDNIIF